jgi:hypothetical protein
LWHFEFGYQSHWGEHVSNLRWYLMRHLSGTDAAPRQPWWRFW